MATKKQKTFVPLFTITPASAGNLMRIEAVRQAIQSLRNGIAYCVDVFPRKTCMAFSPRTVRWTARPSLGRLIP